MVNSADEVKNIKSTWLVEDCKSPTSCLLFALVCLCVLMVWDFTCVPFLLVVKSSWQVIVVAKLTLSSATVS